jgi:hypothetical protein
VILTSLRSKDGVPGTGFRSVSAIKTYEGFGDVDHTIKELMSL